MRLLEYGVRQRFVQNLLCQLVCLFQGLLDGLLFPEDGECHVTVDADKADATRRADHEARNRHRIYGLLAQRIALNEVVAAGYRLAHGEAALAEGMAQVLRRFEEPLDEGKRFLGLLGAVGMMLSPQPLYVAFEPPGGSGGEVAL